MKNIRTVSRQEYDAEVEDKIQKLTKYAYITQGDLAEIIGCCSATLVTIKDFNGYPIAQE